MIFLLFMHAMFCCLSYFVFTFWCTAFCAKRSRLSDVPYYIWVLAGRKRKNALFSSARMDGSLCYSVLNYCIIIIILSSAFGREIVCWSLR